MFEVTSASVTPIPIGSAQAQRASPRRQSMRYWANSVLLSVGK
jgi:hypothetical protein